MIKRIMIAAASALALLGTAPALANSQGETTGQEPQPDAMAEAMEMMTGLFQAEPLTQEQEARLPAASAVVSTMLPEGFYAEMMSEMMDGIMGPMTGLFSGELGATAVLDARLAVEEDALSALSAEEKIELATILDPGFAERGAAMQSMMGEIMSQAAVAIEPLFREGMSRAYAVRFDEAQLADIAAFFDTPTGALYAQESMMLMADPQVMSASMQALPAMMSQFGDMEARIEETFAALPAEKTYADLSEAERARLSVLTGIDQARLAEVVMPPKGDGTP